MTDYTSKIISSYSLYDADRDNADMEKRGYSLYNITIYGEHFILHFRRRNDEALEERVKVIKQLMDKYDMPSDVMSMIINKM